MLILLGAACEAGGQDHQQRSQYRADLHVHVVDAQGKPASLEIRLWGSDSLTEETHSDRNGNAGFFDIPSGSYRLLIRVGTQPDFQTQVFISGGELEHFETVRLPGPPTAEEATVSVEELQISKSAQKQYEAGLLALKQQRWIDARNDFRRIVVKFPRFARAYNGLGVSLAETKEERAAEDAFRKAITLKAGLQEAYVNLADLLLRTGRPGEAQATSEALLRFAPGNADGVRDLVTAEFRQQKFEDVNRIVDSVHARRIPHKASLHEYAAESYRRRGMYGEAEKERLLFEKESQGPAGKSADPPSPQQK